MKRVVTKVQVGGNWNDVKNGQFRVRQDEDGSFRDGPTEELMLWPGGYFEYLQYYNKDNDGKITCEWWVRGPLSALQAVQTQESSE